MSGYLFMPETEDILFAVVTVLLLVFVWWFIQKTKEKANRGAEVKQ
jgi:membrane protein implicated in regulation of membrane protease activity